MNVVVAPELAAISAALLVVGSATSQTPTGIIDGAMTRIRRAGGLVPFIRDAGFGGISFAIILEIVEGVQGFGTVIWGIPKTFGLGFIFLIDVFFQGLGDVFGAGTETTVRAFTDGLASLLGPFAQPASVGIIMLSIAVLVWTVNRLEISPLSFIRRVRS